LGKKIKYNGKRNTNHSDEKISRDPNLSSDRTKNIHPSGTEHRTPFYFYIILISIPILFFVFLELGLRFFNYGQDISMWVTAEEGKLMLNPAVASRYFTSVKNVPASIGDVFDAVKKPSAFRIFVLGESSAAGYPYMPMGSSSRYIRRRLELAYPAERIEVVNISLTAINSYTIRDFIPEVLNQKPDLILIYTGHNEYYGALGVGSMESFGTSRTVVNLILELNKFRTTQLLRNFIQWSASLFSGKEEMKTGTLMSRMAKNQSIGLDSYSYKSGIIQFEENMRDVFEMTKNAKIPVIIGTLTSNLKDLKPFISIKDNKKPAASDIYIQAQTAYNLDNYKIADSLYRYAKDLDELRFRAPEEINRTIKKLSGNYNIPVVDVDSAFCALSPNGIVGDNLMTDHLHPTLHGYQLMGKLYFEKMAKLNLLPDIKSSIPYEKQDSVTLSDFPFYQLDSVIAVYRIKYLKNDWPYIDPDKKISSELLLSPKTYEESLAFDIVVNGSDWAETHEKAVDKYLKEKNIDGLLQHIKILIYQFPFVQDFYKYIDKLALDFLSTKEYEKAYKVLLERYKLKPNDYSTKWLGIIDLNRANNSSAVKYLEESVNMNPNDLQTEYNLAGALALNKSYSKSLQIISSVIEHQSDYPGAQNLRSQILKVLNK
jgi:tetratricopeptide (TPR) repeat protein